ncbi:MAG: alpha/beta hydrolase [Planctomycetota bacterium]
MVRGLKTLPPARFFFVGPAGRLAATLERPAAPPRGAVLHLHPHPLGGGTRRNNVVRHGALGSLEAGCAALRLDFRGAGESEGRHDGGHGEVQDAAAALEELSGRFPGVPLFLWGYSFGARVALELAPAWNGRLAGLLGVAFPNTVFEWPPENAWPERAALLCGDRDSFVDLAGMEAVREQGVPLTIEPGADHFFAGRLERVRVFTAARLSEWLG